jgi:hypothetical protein
MSDRAPTGSLTLEWITSASGPDEIKRMMLNCTQVNNDWLGPSKSIAYIEQIG